MIQISIIILSYNTKELLEKCLQSVVTNLHGIKYEIIVVDNASTDGSRDIISSFSSRGGSRSAGQFPVTNFHWIQNRENVGFARGVNLGSKEAKGKYLLFLNSDAQLKDNSLKEMLAYAEKHEKAGIIGGSLVNTDGSKQRSYGRFYSIPALMIMLIGGDKAEQISSVNGDTPRKADWVSGGFMLIKTELFNQLHGFDEHFFMYIEDMELCYRAHKAGYEIFTYPEAEAVHLHQGSSNRAFAIEHIFAGLLYFYSRHKYRFEYIIVKLLFSLKAALLIGFGTIFGNAYLKDTYCKAWRAIWFN